MRPEVSKRLSLALRLLAAAGCLVWALWGVDLTGVVAVVSRYSLPALIAAQLVQIAALVPPGIRLRFLAEKRITARQGFEAALLCWGLNNVLPAKMGEAAKGIYLKQKAGLPLSSGLGMVFWERFFDLNCVILIGLGVTVALSREAAVAAPALAVAGIWGFLALARVRPAPAYAVIRLLPFAFLRRLSGRILDYIRRRFDLGFLAVLGAYTLPVWIMYSASNFVILWWAAGLELTAGQVLAVFVVSALGMGAPSAPGGVGVFEAAYVLALTWFGVDKEEALAAAVIQHFIQFLPTTVGGLAVAAGMDLDLKGLKDGLGEGDEQRG